MTYLERAMEIKEELIRNRRYLHERPEEGMELPETAAFVTERLKEMGYDPKPCGKSGVTALCGDPAGGVFLLRADMDALPMKEKSGLPLRRRGTAPIPAVMTCTRPCFWGRQGS